MSSCRRTNRCNSGACGARDPLGLNDDENTVAGGDRDDRTMRHAAAKGALRERMAPNNARPDAWGGAMRRMTTTNISPSREDEHRFVSVPGRYVPLGYARYVSPVINPNDYEFYRLAGWRVAVPRSIPGMRVRDLLDRIYYYGPQSAGYVRVNDTLVPAVLGDGDRMTLAQNAFEYEPYPLGP